MKTDKIALVTDAGNNLSLKFANILKDKNYHVIIASKGESYDRLNEIGLDDIKILNVDLTHTSEILKLHTYLKSEYGKLDVLINNAEIANGFGQKITELDIEDVKTLYNENFFAVINITKALYGLLSKSDAASIINISSGLGHITKMKDDSFCYSNYRMTAYATAKSALEMLTVLLQKEFKNTTIKVASFDPVRPSNSTYNSLVICNGVKNELLELIA